MITASIVILVSVMVFDTVVMSRAVQRIRVDRGLKAEPLSLRNPGQRPPAATVLRWLEPANAAPQDRGSRPRAHQCHG